jgi:hypothetical protein
MRDLSRRASQFTSQSLGIQAGMMRLARQNPGVDDVAMQKNIVVQSKKMAVP